MEEINMKNLEVKKLLSTALVLVFTAQGALAVQNYTVTTTTNENYSASSPVGQFNNYSSNGAAYVTTIPMYNNYNYNNGYNNGYSYYSQPVENTQYYDPAYSTGVTYRTNPNYSQNYSSQTINNPQQYNRTVSTTQQYVDTREKADKVIDRGVKVVGTLAVVGAVTGILINAFK